MPMCTAKATIRYPILLRANGSGRRRFVYVAVSKFCAKHAAPHFATNILHLIAYAFAYPACDAIKYQAFALYHPFPTMRSHAGESKRRRMTEHMGRA